MTTSTTVKKDDKTNGAPEVPPTREDMFESDVRDTAERVGRKCRALGIPFLMAFDLTADDEGPNHVEVMVGIPKGSESDLLAAFEALKSESTDTSLTLRGGKVAGVSTPE